jgi:hypothetical protein
MRGKSERSRKGHEQHTLVRHGLRAKRQIPDDAERGKQLDGLLYSDEAQDGGMLVFTVLAIDESAAMRLGQTTYAAWRNGTLPEVR